MTIDFGIDLGTTNSSIACCRGGEVRIFQNNELMNVTPSVVYVAKSGRMLVGRRAYDIWIQDSENTQAEFKRWMGLSDRLSFPGSGRSMSAEELSAEVLKALRADAQRQTTELVDAAVITVPAAFGSLQCEATARAAKLAGFEQAPLLQEPVAAAIAYGASPSSRNQRWMVFDFGGGTLDIAIVSTRNGRLAVLDHQGDNRLGGKDLDRVIAESFFLRVLAQSFALPDSRTDFVAYDRLFRRLLRHAEHAKIGLSSATEVPVDLFDLGDDLGGKAIEATITIRRDEMEAKVASVIDRCLDLARRALEGARLSGADLDRVLLVGGPTQMPVVRQALESELSAKLDCSLDPMTVVAYGASLFAATLEKTVGADIPVPAAPKSAAAAKAVAIKLSHERASGTPQSPVAGVVPPKCGIKEIRIDADGGFWTSGWLTPVNGAFQIDVMLLDRKPMTRFTIVARDAAGRPVATDPAQFSINYMLPMAAPPLPHTISVETSNDKGNAGYDQIFQRHCPLPAEAHRTYRAERTLRPSEAEATLPIKFWEVEVSDDPQERWWAGCVHIRADKIKRPLMEGSEIELTVKIDASRKLTVEVFIPLLGQSFSEGVYIPDPPTAGTQLDRQLELIFERLDRIRRGVYEADRDDLRERIDILQLKAETIYESVNEQRKGGSRDPDAALGPTDALRRLGVQIAQIEEQIETDGGAGSPLARSVRAEARWTENLIIAHGTEADRQEFSRLASQLERYIETDDVRGLKYISKQLIALRSPVLDRQPWFWRNLLQHLRRPGRRFVNRAEADTWLAKAEKAEAENNLPALREAINKAWALQPPDQVETAKEQVAQSGLRS